MSALRRLVGEATDGLWRAIPKHSLPGFQRPGQAPTITFSGPYSDGDYADAQLCALAPELALLVVQMGRLIEDVGYSDKERWQKEAQEALARLAELEAGLEEGK